MQFIRLTRRSLTQHSHPGCGSLLYLNAQTDFHSTGPQSPAESKRASQTEKRRSGFEYVVETPVREQTSLATDLRNVLEAGFRPLLIHEREVRAFEPMRRSATRLVSIHVMFHWMVAGVRG